MIFDLDIENNFWKINPAFKKIGQFGEVYKKDKSKIKRQSSDLAWAAVFNYSKYSPYYNLPVEDKKKRIERDVFDKKNSFDEKEIKKFEDIIDKLEKTSADRLYDQWNMIVEKRRKHIDHLAENYAKNVDKIDKLIMQNGKLFGELERIEKQLKKEDVVKQRTQGGGKESLSEQGALDIE